MEGSIKIRDTIQCFLPGIHLPEKEQKAGKERNTDKTEKGCANSFR